MTDPRDAAITEAIELVITVLSTHEANPLVGHPAIVAEALAFLLIRAISHALDPADNLDDLQRKCTNLMQKVVEHVAECSGHDPALKAHVAAWAARQGHSAEIDDLERLFRMQAPGEC